MVGFLCVQASFPKKSSDSHCCVELPFLVLLSASEENAQRKWSIFFSKILNLKAREEIRSRETFCVNNIFAAFHHFLSSWVLIFLN